MMPRLNFSIKNRTVYLSPTLTLNDPDQNVMLFTIFSHCIKNQNVNFSACKTFNKIEQTTSIFLLLFLRSTGQRFHHIK